MHTYVRQPVHRQQHKSKPLTSETNESHRFVRLIEETNEQLSPSTCPIHVIDREGDIYELLVRLSRCHHRYVIRSSKNRATPQRHPAGPGHVRVSEVLQGLEGIAEREVCLSARGRSSRPPRAQKIHPTRKGRVATLSFRATRIALRRPDDCSSALPPSHELNLVHVTELDAPEGHEPVQWQLLTSEPIASEEEVLRVVDIYRARWTIEELFKALKTGCRFEQRQLRSYDALCRLLAVLLPVAWFMLRLRTAARTEPERPAFDFLSTTQLAVLAAVSKRVPLGTDPTANEALRAIAGLGGHLKRNGPPGWLTLGRGMDRLLTLAFAYGLGLDHAKIQRTSDQS